jgi:hypothetical protein
VRGDLYGEKGFEVDYYLKNLAYPLFAKEGKLTSQKKG